CAEYCGGEHSRMVGQIVAMPAEAYDAWLERREPGEMPLAAAGREVFARHDCATCHDTHANKPAPPLEGLVGRRRVFEDGAALVADEAYLRESVLEPSARVVAGYAVAGRSPMPSYAGVLTNEELFELLYYLRTLKDATGVSR
ncbi:MAG: c-type cytochrome, partial [Myxococcales bacterium]|nr:c-type cytochrome [Myxococcales bacterium]